MNREIGEKWVAALRSGKYQQGKGYLAQFVFNENNPNEPKVTYCCLGVLCEIVTEECPTFTKKTESTGFVWDRSRVILPDSIADYTRLHSNNGYIPENPESGKDSTYLDALNDAGMDFATIANLIEQNIDIL